MPESDVIVIGSGPLGIGAARRLAEGGLNSDLAAGIPEAYVIAGPPTVEAGEMLMQLRDAA
ncbi:MAG: hypothetical protein GY798_32650 [Hyphomicrobiales bacterium]|nr:hypothetical protein [Hyphomicrobiales bacterium]